MRLCILADAGSYHTKRWVDYFVQKGWEVNLISLEEPILKTRGIEHIIPPKVSIKWLKYPLSIPEIKRLIYEMRPNIFNAHFVPNYGFVSAILRLKPLVISTWGSDILISARRSPIHRLRIQFALSRADLVTADAKNLARAVEGLGVSPDKIITVPMGVDLSVWKRRRSIKKAQVQILSYRRLEPIYNVELLIRAIPNVVKIFQDRVRFIIAGTGSQKGYLIDLVSRLGIREYVHFTGESTPAGLKRLLSESDIYISPSLSDSTSVSLLEAMACGLFPIVSNIPGNREWITDGKNGLLFHPKSKDELAARLIWALENRRFWAKAASINRKIVKSRASWQENMRVIETAFTRLSGSFR